MNKDRIKFGLDIKLQINTMKLGEWENKKTSKWTKNYKRKLIFIIINYILDDGDLLRNFFAIEI